MTLIRKSSFRKTSIKGYYKYYFQYRAWARPESVHQTKVALAAGVKIIDYYEDYFGIDYPLPKQGESTLDLSIKLLCFIDR